MVSMKMIFEVWHDGDDFNDDDEMGRSDYLETSLAVAVAVA